MYMWISTFGLNVEEHTYLVISIYVIEMQQFVNIVISFLTDFIKEDDINIEKDILVIMKRYLTCNQFKLDILTILPLP